VNFDREQGKYQTVAASQTAQIIGKASGDYLSHLIIVPATAAAGAVTLIDGSTSISIFAGGGTTALGDLTPIAVPIRAYSVNGPWKITTGANVSVIAVGNLT
jgi:hypothetical protein